MARGYQKGSPDAFVTSTTVDGLSIAYGDPPQHIWSYVAGHYDKSPGEYHQSNCPCATNPGAQSSHLYFPKQLSGMVY